MSLQNALKTSSGHICKMSLKKRDQIKNIRLDKDTSSKCLLKMKTKYVSNNAKGCWVGTHQHFSITLLSTEAVTRRCSVKKVFLKISQNSLENTCARVFFLIKLQAEVCIVNATLLEQPSWLDVIYKSNFIEHFDS